ncbi:hypothetical protein ACOSQ4_017040 [Xanthoceras sorbifolium]
MFEFNATVTFLGQRHEIGTFLRDYISLQMLWESTMIVTLKRKLAVGERLIQHVPIPWSGENRAVHSDSDLMDVLAEFEAKKTLTNEHTCLAITKNRDANSTWLGKKFQDLIKENPDISIRVLHGVVLRTCGLDVNNHTLRRAKTYAMNIGEKKTWQTKLQRRRGLNEPQNVPRSSSLKCSICHEVGHNSRTCKKKNDGQSGGNQGTTTSSTPSTSTATNRRRMEVSFFLLYLTPTNRNAKTNFFLTFAGW